MAAVPSIGRAVDIELGAPAGESLALEGLYERHSHSVFRFCLSLLRKRDEAEDAAQTTFLYALRALRRGVVPASESAWLLKIARNVCLNRFDAVRRRGTLELIQDPCVLEETAAARPGQELDLIGLQAALERLPERQRQAILLREWQGLSYAEIAAELGLTTSAVETLLFRARRSLARELGEDETRRGLDLASLLGSAKAFLGGSAAKLAMGAAAVATVGVVAPAALHATHPSRAHARTPAPQPHGSLPASRPVRAVAAPAARAVGRAHPVLQSRAAPPKPASAQAPAAPAPSPGAAVPAAAAPAAAPAKPPETPAAGTPNAAAGPAGAAAPALPDVTPALPVPVTVPAVPDVAPVVQTVASALPALPAPPPPATPALPTVSVTPPLH